MKKIRLVLIFSMISFSVFSQKSPGSKLAITATIDSPVWMKGEWRGLGYQMDGVIWDIVFIQDSSGKCTVNYPTLGCSGSWNIISSDEGRVVLNENIVDGITLCDQGDIIILNKVSDNYVSVSFFLKDFSEKLIAHGVLTKQ